MILVRFFLLLVVCGIGAARTGPKFDAKRQVGGEAIQFESKGQSEFVSRSFGGHSYRQFDARVGLQGAGSVMPAPPLATEYRTPPERVQKVFDKKRAIRKLEGDFEEPNLGMNCGDKVGYACQLYMLEYLNTYVYVNKSYDSLLIPVRNNAEKPVDVHIVVTFVDLVSVDTVSGTMTVSVFIDYIWTDVFMTWNKTLTEDDGFIVVPNNLLWIPDIIIFNSIGGFRSQIDAEAVFLSSDGEAWWSGRGVMTFACTYDVVDFPFDSHTCSAEFSSWIYSLNNINISSVAVDVLDSFNNLAWQVDSVTGHREEVYLWGGAYLYTFGVFDVSITRYYEHYISSAIFPSIIITAIVLSSLFMGDDFGSRLALAVTGLLTIIAIQWSVADELPVAKQADWLSNFLNVGVVYIALTTLECYVSAVMAGRKHGTIVPTWVIYLIDISLFWEFMGPNKKKNVGSGNTKGAEDGGVELRSAAEAVNNPLSKTDELGAGSDSSYSSTAESGDATSSIPQQRKRSIFQSTRRSIFGPAGPPKPMEAPEIRYTWERGSRALDRISRIILPISYAILLAFWLGEKL